MDHGQLFPICRHYLLMHVPVVSHQPLATTPNLPYQPQLAMNQPDHWAATGRGVGHFSSPFIQRDKPKTASYMSFVIRLCFLNTIFAISYFQKRATVRFQSNRLATSSLYHQIPGAETGEYPLVDMTLGRLGLGGTIYQMSVCLLVRYPTP